jgi:hypothetical protein
MGVAVIFGLLFGTILTLVIVPVMYSTLSDAPEFIKSTFKKLIAKNKTEPAVEN